MLLIRHGRTTLNAERRFCGGGSNPPLDATGHAQVASLRARIEAALGPVFCSPQTRALETAAGLGLTPKSLTVLDDLRELDQGVLEGRRFKSAMAEHADFFADFRRDPGAARIPGGETMDELADRVHTAVMTAVAQPAQPGALTVVCHQMAQAAFCVRALGLPMTRWPTLELANARANLLAFDGHSWRLVAQGL